MYLYNVTIIVENDVHKAIKQRLATVLADPTWTGAPAALLEMLDSPHEGTTYCLQLRTAHEEDITAFQTLKLNSIQTWINTEYPGKAVFFESVMKYLSLTEINN